MAEGGKVKNTGNKVSVQQKTRQAYESPRTRVRENKHNTEGGLTEAERKAILEQEEKNISAFKGKYEIASVANEEGVINPLGNPMVKGTKKKRVTRAEYEKAMSEVQHGTNNHVYTRSDRRKGMTYTHTHPVSDTFGTGLGSRIGASFSGADISSAAKTNSRSTRARTPNYVFSLRPKNNKGDWGASPEVLQLEWNSAYQRERQSMINTINRIAMKHGMTSKEYTDRVGRLNALASHRATQYVAKKHDYIYTRRKVR